MLPTRHNEHSQSVARSRARFFHFRTFVRPVTAAETGNTNPFHAGRVWVVVSFFLFAPKLLEFNWTMFFHLRVQCTNSVRNGGNVSPREIGRETRKQRNWATVRCVFSAHQITSFQRYYNNNNPFGWIRKSLTQIRDRAVDSIRWNQCQIGASVCVTACMWCVCVCVPQWNWKNKWECKRVDDKRNIVMDVDKMGKKQSQRRWHRGKSWRWRNGHACPGESPRTHEKFT